MHRKTEELIINTITDWLSGLPGQALISGVLAGVAQGASVASELLHHGVETALVDGRHHLKRHLERASRRECSVESDDDQPIGHEAVLMAEIAQLEADLKSKLRVVQMQERLAELKAEIAGVDAVDRLVTKEDSDA